MSKETVTISLHDFKAHISEYLQKLHHDEEEAYIIRRYKRNVAIVLGLRRVNRNGKAREDAEKLNLLIGAHERHDEQRRLIAARLLSWPGSKYYGCPGCEDRLKRREERAIQKSFDRKFKKNVGQLDQH